MPHYVTCQECPRKILGRNNKDCIICHQQTSSTKLCSKLDKKAVKCIFIGYDNQRKGCKCSDPTTGSKDADVEQGATRSFGQSIVHQPTCEGSETNEGEVPTVPQSETRRSEWVWRQNSKYANTTIIEDESGKEPESFEEAAQNLAWTRAIE
ncbi:hypothetical protein KY290_014153 [Solanum tuberosum]|uniref:Retroviral polymerase SH3-like domain-containing protein n=1 Tax=Solanum tuberosum TaxID=4113 RepID=A0ABQ7VNT3_SOLTU|nr:hypothetical protein KY285_013595 [Solanum tuberosum]KAH0770172.1 hypothetical protein KY290_014153 [Solanum tuberosum]